MHASDVAARAWKAMPHTVGRRLSYGDYTAPAHVKLVSWLLHLNMLGYVPRLAISQPPRTSKTLTVDVWGSVCLLEHRPEYRIVCASYSGLLASEQGREVRNVIEAHPDKLSVRISDDSRARDAWRTTKHGGMWSMGVGGTLTGRGANRMVVDDAHKDHAEALSETISENVWNWFRAVARTRVMPKGSIVIPMTRWADGDLIGRLQAQDETRQGWMFARLPAIAEETETLATVIGQHWVDRLAAQKVQMPRWHREQGQALWPELAPGVPWFDETEYADIRADVGEWVWGGLYQQRPVPLEGGMFQRRNWQTIDAVPPGPCLYVRRWDLAGSVRGDWTAGVLMALHQQTRMLYVVDVVHERLQSAAVEQLVLQTAISDRDRYGTVHTRIEREPGSAGLHVEQSYLRLLEGFDVKFVPATGSKEIRALPFAAQQQARRVHLVRREVEGVFVTPEWWDAYRTEHEMFLGGAKNDDQVDGSAGAYADLLELSPRRAKATITTAVSQR